VAYLGGGGGHCAMALPLWRMRKFLEGLEGRWKGGWPPVGRIYGSGTENWRVEKVSKKKVAKLVVLLKNRSTAGSFPKKVVKFFVTVNTAPRF
jgi:hypothetical protein